MGNAPTLTNALPERTTATHMQCAQTLRVRIPAPVAKVIPGSASHARMSTSASGTLQVATYTQYVLTCPALSLVLAKPVSKATGTNAWRSQLCQGKSSANRGLLGRGVTGPPQKAQDTVSSCRLSWRHENAQERRRSIAANLENGHHARALSITCLTFGERGLERQAASVRN